MSLNEKQWLFTKLTGQLIGWAYKNDYQLAYGEALRSDEQAEINAMGPAGRTALISILRQHSLTALAAKIENNAGSGLRITLHERGLAVDLKLFIHGVYMTESKDYLPLGEFWESLDPLCCWGGRFSKPDGNHFSLTDGGIK